MGAPGLNTHSPELPWAMPAFGPEWMDTQAPLDPGMYREPSGPWFREPLKKVNTGRCVGHQQSWMLVCKDGSCSWRPRQLLVTRLTLRGWGGRCAVEDGAAEVTAGPRTGWGGDGLSSEKPGPVERGGLPLLLSGVSGINQEVRTDICACSVASGESDSL